MEPLFWHFKNNDASIELENKKFTIDKIELLKGVITNANVKILISDTQTKNILFGQLISLYSKTDNNVFSLTDNIVLTNTINIQQFIMTNEETEFKVYYVEQNV
jgi:hypothetical protein